MKYLLPIVTILLAITSTLYAKNLLYYEVSNGNATFYSGFNVFERYTTLIRPMRKDTAVFRNYQQSFLDLLVTELNLNKRPYSIEIIVDFPATTIISAQSVYYRVPSIICYNEGRLLGNVDSTLQIYYSHTLTDTNYHYDKIFALVKYAVENFGSIKSHQKQISLIMPEQYRYRKNDSILYALGIDTLITQNITVRPINFKGWPQALPKSKTHWIPTNFKGSPQDLPKSKTHWIPIGILLVTGIVLSAKSLLSRKSGS